MDAKGKKIDVNASSLVDLKAELYRKQNEFRQEKSQGSTKPIKGRKTETKPNIWSKKNIGVYERAQADCEAKREEEDVMGRSKAALVAKSKLYEKMTSGETVPDEDGSQLFLVDFEKKAIDLIFEKRREKLQKEQEERERQKAEETRKKREAQEMEEDKRLLMETVAPPDNPEEEWVEYTDSFGRSRKCMKKDLPQFQKMDDQLGFNQDKPDTSQTTEPQLMSEDMRRELQRQKWEEEMEAKGSDPIHYSDVQFGEIRNHGVGYYQFSKQEESRKEEMEMLKDLREQTVNQRDKLKKLKEKRKAMIEARLAKVKQRRMMRGGTETTPNEATTEDKELSISERLQQEEQEKVAEPLTRDDDWRKSAPLREWDIGKEKVFNEETWKQGRRDERSAEFAPPVGYYDSGPLAKPKNFAQKRKTLYGKQDPLDRVADRQTAGQTVLSSTPYPTKPGASEIIRQSRDVAESVSAALSVIRSEVKEDKTMEVDVTAIPLPKQDVALPKENITFPEQNVALPKENITLPNQNIALQPHNVIPKQQVPPILTSQQDHVTALQSTESNETETSLDTTTQPYNYYQQYPQYHQNYHPQYHVPDTHHHIYNPQLPQGYPPHMIPPVSGQQVGKEPGITHGFVQPVAMTTSGIVSAEPAQSQKATVTGEPANIINTSQSEPLGDFAPVKASPIPGPQPAHYSSAPMKPQPKGPQYKRVNLHELPLELPKPPTAACTPQYPSQEEMLTTKRNKNKPVNENVAIKRWQSQYRYTATDADVKKSSVVNLRPANIPFASPYIQKKDQSEKLDPAAGFDPTIPPPTVKKKD